MSETKIVHARRSREAKLVELGLEYPLWVFDVDQTVWPRKLADILPGSRPAKITGWYTWYWEYGTDLRRIDDKLPQNVIAPERSIRNLGSIDSVLSQLLYDDTYESESLRVVYETDKHGVETTRDFSNWCSEPSMQDYVAPKRIISIERKWDDAPIWDRRNNINILFGDRSYSAYGMASWVTDDQELLRATGVWAVESGDKIRKAQFELLDGDNEQAYGIVYPAKNQEDHGLYMIRGPEFDWNKKVLLGTALENAPWSEVESYVRREMKAPLQKSN